MKISSHDIVAILREFKQADLTLAPRSIDQLKVTHPTEHTTIAFFRAQKRQFGIIVDVTAEDDLTYIEQYLRELSPDFNGEFITNPDNPTTHAISFKGKDAYLFKYNLTKRRLDIRLSELYPETSRSTWQKHIKAGHIHVDGEIVDSPKYEIESTATIAVHLPPQQDHTDNSLPIVYIDDNVIVINKPIGILTHAKGALADEFTAADFFRRYTSYHLDTNRPGIIHRLDRDTSGILIGARNPETATLLQKQFAERRVKKTYLAITQGLLKQKSAQIELPIERNPSAPSTFRVGAKGKLATTRYRVLAEQADKSLVELSPLTGRTHQLRVHMAYLGAPIYGDRVYGTAADRLYLHARQLEVTIPTGARKTFTAPIPEEFTKIFPHSL